MPFVRFLSGVTVNELPITGAVHVCIHHRDLE